MLGLAGSRSIKESLRLLSFLPRHRLKSMRWLVLLSLVPGFLDFASIAVVGRLTGALIGGSLSNILPGIRVFGGGQLQQSLWLVALFIFLTWLQSAIRIVLRIVQERTASGIWLDLSDQIFAGIIRQPYEYHLSTNLSKVSSDLLGNLECLLKEIVTPILRGVSNLVSIVILTIGIVYIGKSIALGLLTTMIASYIIMSVVMTPALRIASAQKVRTRELYTQTFFEVFKSIKDVKLVGVEDYFSRRFRESTLEFKQADTLSLVLPELPRMLIEPLGITAIFALGVLPRILSGDRQQILEILPFLAALSIGALRLAKPLQDFFTAVSKLRGGLPELSIINELLILNNAKDVNKFNISSPDGIFPLRTISLNSASYHYPNSKKLVLDNINISVPVGSRVAFVGPTGGGKSTAAYLLLALLNPQKGSLKLDGIDVDLTDVKSWHNCCSQVPQNIQLLDKSVMQNIAFGIEEEVINVERVWDSLESAQLAEFVSELPFGLHSLLGENGINLSGGQRQRIALARAFYRDSKFLVLDEATSALDNKTESDVIQSLEIVGRRCTTVVIAHRLSTIQRCDRIYEFDNGKIVCSGNYQELQQRSESFRNLVRLQDSY
ncbi:ABC transporter ATP-binding protein [Synechococcus sp. MVIR-18-1]|uniref:ABC transporter ATP-binding protein n=1 Tax=Synechococcus sp. MVIR-18-1 TaxID=1386941 RepID=UPI0021073FE7|nr:ABC transporter ATP-binding protein [Synechococcus sp. MVIR-18-1]